jgi:hypothetical protein
MTELRYLPNPDFLEPPGIMILIVPLLNIVNKNCMDESGVKRRTNEYYLIYFITK